MSSKRSRARTPSCGLVQNLEKSAGSGLSADASCQLDDLRTEIQLLSEELTNKEQVLDALKQRPATGDGDSSALIEENARLHKQIAELSKKPRRAEVVQ